ncbi:SnoaL-like domain - like 2 [Theobroma cacao]|nr:SnoaL-like domain - like 2 [Theobroma cacao]
MEIAYSLSIALQSHQQLIIATIITLLSLLLAVRSFFKRPHKSNALGPVTSTGKKEPEEATSSPPCNCSCSCNGTSHSAVFLNGGSAGPVQEGMVTADVSKVAAERQSGASMMEQLVPEITTHALSYLDYPSLCRLSMTNSLMRKAANDDNAWKALYHKDFTLEQDSVTPVNGWKAYYAATRAIMNVNAEFFNIIRDRSLQAMSRFWLNADYVKCVHASGELFSGYNAVIQSWQLAFNWEQGVDFQVIDVRARVLTDMAWVTMKTFVDMDNGAFNMTNVFEFHNGRWYLVHHHSSVMLADGDVEQQIVHG